MTGREELALIAELGVAFAGFLAIFLIFARREGRFSPADSLRVRSIIVSSLAAVFLALAPLAMSLYGWQGAVLWRAASGLVLVIGVLLISNIFEVFGAPSAAPYVAALICTLGIAASNFVTIAFQRLL